MTVRTPLWSLAGALCLAFHVACSTGAPGPAGPVADPAGGEQTRSGAVAIPLTVRGFAERPVPPMPVWTGVPLPRSAVKDAESLRLLDARGRAVPAQFDVQARWADGSIKWVLVSFAAAGRAGRRGSGAWSQLGYTLVSDASIAPPRPARPVSVRQEPSAVTITTGPLKILIDAESFRGISRAWLDINGNGKFEDAELISAPSQAGGIVAVDAAGKVYSSARGRVRRVELERAGPVHAVVAVHGELSADRPGKPLLNYAMRIHAFAGSSLVRVVLTIHNPRACDRSGVGSRWVLGLPGSVFVESLQYVQPVRLDEGLRRVTMSPEPGRIFDRIPLTGPMCLYQDSSGGENWFHRTHVDKDNVIPLSFRGYRVSYRGREIHRGLRARPWVDVADVRWAVSLAAPAFWENFPKALAVEADGTIRLGLWPEQFKGLHEIQAGEQKTHEFWVYFRHRRRTRRQPRLMPLARELMPPCLNRPIVWASAEAYARADVLDPIVPANRRLFPKYEALMAAPVRDRENLFTHRERADEYGWRNFGDTWAANESTKTSGPYHGLRVVSHYNNEYDLGFGMLQQALRYADADPELARSWWRLGIEALWHEADIDIYHTRADRRPIYNGGTYTHTAHGVEAGRSTHRGSPRDELWGRLDWPWGRGSCPESGHFRNRGILTAYLLTGDRHLLDAANDARDLIVYKVSNDQFAQIDWPNRDTGNNIQILLDAYLLTGERKYLQLCDKCAERASFDAVVKRTGRALHTSSVWQYGLFLKSLGRLIEVKAELGIRDEKSIDSFLKYARAIYQRFYVRRGRRWGTSSWSLLLSEVMTQAAELTDDPAERQRFIAAAKSAFHGLDYLIRRDGSGSFWNSKSTTMHLQGGGRYMRWAVRQRRDTAR